ncbi:helix-turn-helix domain-containing protein [Mucilaginibacter sp. P25]|uniref:Helix-turn-helix n=1 Tax=Mucilaginibacter gossypiicola TaxID=551995 RepID=A0A1H8AVH6_9SPHI|nr:MULTISPECIES: helix-turn-helix transcriptional regulator [Mucilaginibacter]UOE52235.1 helix-turn-helix domain-containing protein [Mucilaginibacter sp. SMC90]SEM74720.1 Helix-turn-helix [Mucilaginibacter gossypiicola]
MESEAHKLLLTSFGKHVASLRKKKKLSYRKVAQQCELEFSTIKKYEKGEFNMTFISLSELAKGLGIPLKELMDF